MFVDEVDIHVKAGDGGGGALSFRREKFVPKGGPDGGNGGAGGSVFLVADPHRNTLVHFRFNPDYKAQRGGNGAGALRTGRGGRDLEIPVPVGTLVFKIDPETGEKQQAADLTVVGQRVLLAQGALACCAGPPWRSAPPGVGGCLRSAPTLASPFTEV